MPAGAVVITARDFASTTLTLFELLLATNTRRPSGLTMTPRGRWPSATVATTLRVDPSMTVRLSDFSLVTKIRSSARARAGTRTAAPRIRTTSGNRRMDVVSAKRSAIGPLPAPMSGSLEDLQQLHFEY